MAAKDAMLATPLRKLLDEGAATGQSRSATPVMLPRHPRDCTDRYAHPLGRSPRHTRSRVSAGTDRPTRPERRTRLNKARPKGSKGRANVSGKYATTVLVLSFLYMFQPMSPPTIASTTTVPTTSAVRETPGSLRFRMFKIVDMVNDLQSPRAPARPAAGSPALTARVQEVAASRQISGRQRDREALQPRRSLPRQTGARDARRVRPPHAANHRPRSRSESRLKSVL